MTKWIYASILSLALFGCATGKCVDVNTAHPVTTAPNSGDSVMKPESKLDRVKVFKADGSLQCGQGKMISTADMQKDLKDIKVYSSLNKNDGMMRIQVCGTPTGNSNVYEIDRSNLAAALKLGFKEWSYDN